MNINLISNKGALFSFDDQYRYQLWRVWNADLPTVCFIQPVAPFSDGSSDDETVKRCVQLAKDWGFGGMYIVYLYALRTQSAAEVLLHQDPIGPDNDVWIRNAIRTTTKHVFLVKEDCAYLFKTRINRILPWIPNPIFMDPRQEKYRMAAFHKQKEIAAFSLRLASVG